MIIPIDTQGHQQESKYNSGLKFLLALIMERRSIHQYARIPEKCRPSLKNANEITSVKQANVAPANTLFTDE